MLRRLARERHCDVIHAHSRAPAWSAYFAARMTGIAFVTSWYKGFREQNALKRFYNSVMARGDRVIAVSGQLAELVHQRYGTPWDRITVVPTSVDCSGVRSGRRRPRAHRCGAAQLGRRSEHQSHSGGRPHDASQRPSPDGAGRAAPEGSRAERFHVRVAGEDQGGFTRYAGELWDLVLANDTTDVVQLVGAIDDLPAAYAASTVACSAAVQAGGTTARDSGSAGDGAAGRGVGAGRRAGRSAVAAGCRLMDRMTGLRVAAGDDAALATALIRLFTMPEPMRDQIGRRGRAWVLGHFNAATVIENALALYADVTTGKKILIISNILPRNMTAAGGAEGRRRRRSPGSGAPARPGSLAAPRPEPQLFKSSPRNAAYR